MVYNDYHKSLMDPKIWIVPTILSIIVIVLSHYSFLGFHTVAELFTIIISYMMFAFAFSTKEFVKNKCLMFLASGYFWVGSLDLMHTFYVTGIHIFTPGSSHLTIEFWMLARSIEVLLFLGATISTVRQISPMIIFVMTGLVSIIGTFLILDVTWFDEWLPEMFIEGKGLTLYKIIGEYMIITLLGYIIYRVLANKTNSTTSEKALIIVSLIFTILAEISFTVYVNLHDVSAMVGHVFKIYSFWFIFHAIIMSNVKSPYYALKESNLNLETTLTELKETEKALRRSQKMDAIGELSGGLAHDFNNMLGIILGNLELAQLELKSGTTEQLNERLDAASRSATRSANITTKLLRFATPNPESVTSVNINKTIKSLKDLISKSLTNRISIEMILANDLWKVEIDEEDFEDSMINLALNAKDSIDDNGRLIIESSNITLNGNRNAAMKDMLPGDYVEISISDTGRGMSKEIADKIFDPFFTTKAKNEGTGLGLAMVYGFVQRANGHITVYSEEDIGTTFRMFLPRATVDKIIKPKCKSYKPNIQIEGEKTILIVDDEPALTKVANDSLTKRGYKTVTATSGNHAMTILKENPEIDLLFSDVIIKGGMNGFELADYTVEHYPDIRILMTSGFTGRMISYKSVNNWNDRILRKPYQMSELIKRIENLFTE